MTTEQPDRILRLKTVLALTGLSRSTLYRKMIDRSFPQQISISKRCVGWRESSVRRWTMSPMFYRVDETGQ